MKNINDDGLTTVAFRTDAKGQFKGSITAVFPYLVYYGEYMTCYAQVGQHHACSREWVLGTTKPSTSIEYADLKAELEGLGYNLKVIHRFPKC